MIDIGHEPSLEPPEPRACFCCDCCGETIYEGDSFCLLHGWRICESCIDDGMMIAEPDELDESA